MVSVILNCFKRPDSLKLQYEAIQKQTASVNEVLLWKNNGLNTASFDKEILGRCKFADSNENFGVWSRFAYALNAKSEFILLLDDDTIPGPLWLENCLREYEKQPAVYGTIGVTFFDLDYVRYRRDGWAEPNEKTVRADIVGHAWFIHRSMLGAFWMEAPVPVSPLCGEDMHLSYSVQKYLGLQTLVPPHPRFETAMWGSQIDTAYKFGVDENAISVNHHSSIFGQSLKHYHKKGFRLQYVP